MTEENQITQHDMGSINTTSAEVIEMNRGLIMTMLDNLYNKVILHEIGGSTAALPLSEKDHQDWREACYKAACLESKERNKN